MFCKSKYAGVLFLLIFIIIFPISSAEAKEIKYPVSAIPKELRENARSVVRYNMQEFELKTSSSGVLRVTFAITVLNKNGIDDAYFTEYYDKFSKISGISGKVYDENGVLVKKIKTEDIVDYSAISGFSIFDDNRVKHFDPKYRVVPYTLEYTYEASYTGLFSYPNWSPYTSPYYNISTEYSGFRVIVPNGVEINYKEQNILNKVIIKQEGENKVYLWEAKNLKALIDEPVRAPSRSFMPLVLLAPRNFIIEGYSGSLSSWKDFGIWISKLNQGKNNLSEETKAELRNLVKDAKTDYEKVKILYEYMQGKTRYVSIQIGIGGWQPFEAATVHRLSYGDCKALANYMKSILEAVGIDSKYLLVYAGDTFSDLMVDFPSTQFNHAFLCVPQEKDTLWLECTSQRVPCGYISDFTDDRDVLLIDGENSKIVHTKAYTAEDNTESRVAQVKFTTTSGGEAVVRTNYKGLNYDKIQSIFLADDATKKEKINNRINLPTFQLVNFSYKENRALIPSFDEVLTINFQNYGTVAGQRVFMPLNFMNRFDNIPERVRNRKTDMLIRRPFTDIDTVIYEIPKGLKIEALPTPIEIKGKFGSYKAKAETADNKIIYTRFFRMNKGKYPPEAYSEFLEFLEKVATADGVKCSLTL